MKKKAIFIICLLQMMTISIYPQETEFPKLTGPYLGQKPPGRTCIPFTSELFSQDDAYSLHSTVTFSPDGSTLYFTRTIKGKHTIFFMAMHPKDSLWSGPRPVPFTDAYSQDRLVFDPETGNGFFHSNRPLVDGEKQLDIWMVVRQYRGWSDPIHLPEPVNSGHVETSPTVSRNGNIYFSSDREGGYGNRDIYKAVKTNGFHWAVENLGAPVNTDCYESPQLIAPDESWLIFYAMDRKADHYFYITLRDSDGVWSAPVSMGEDINKDMPFAASLSPDGKYLFLLKRLKGVYWVDAKIIKELQPKK